MVNCAECVYKHCPRIPNVIPKKADIMIVGEAPGTTELARKEVFIGPAGQLLNKLIQTVNLPAREEIHVTNALMCLPPKNKPKIKQAIDLCRERIMEEIELVQPKLIIALGNIAMHALTGDYDLKITAEQGRILTSPLVPGVKILPALHPAAILRAPGDYKLLYGVFAYAAQLHFGQTPLDAGQTEWNPVETEAEVKQMIYFLKDNADEIEVVAADIETTGLNSRQDKVLVLGIAYDKNKVFVIPVDSIDKQMFLQEIDWCWHNGKFDISFLRRMGTGATVDHDTMLLSYCLNEAGGIHALEGLAARLIGAPAYKHKVRKKIGKKGFGSLSLEDQYERVATDADYTRQVFLKLREQVEANLHLKKLYYDLLIPASNFLRRVERNGICVDMDLLYEFKEEYEEELANQLDKMLDIAMPLWDPEEYKRRSGAKTAPEVINPSSPKQLEWLLYDRLRLPPPRVKQGQSRSTDKKALERNLGKHPLVDRIMEYRTIEKEFSTYIMGVLNRLAGDGKIHTTFTLHVTTTGRLSSRNPNIQNIPNRRPRIRTMYRAPEGRKLIEADYKGAELRVLAEFSRDKFLTKCFVEGRDLHAEVAKAQNLERVRAKAVNFGIAYGRTEFSIAEEFGISKTEARKYIDDWFERSPEAKKYLDECAQAVLEGRSLITPFGRHRRFGLVTKENLHELQNEARNFKIQSVASDFTLISAMRAETILAERDVKIINLVHDSILMEAPDNPTIIRKAIELVDHIMRTVPKDTINASVPFEVEFKVGIHWGALEEVK